MQTPYTKVIMKNIKNGMTKTPENSDIKKMKQTIRQLKSDMKSLRNTIKLHKRENEQLQKALGKSYKHMTDQFDGISVEDVIKLVNKPKQRVLQRREDNKSDSERDRRDCLDRYKNFGKESICE